MKVLRLSWTLNNFRISFLKLLDGIPYVRSCLLCHLSNSSYDQYLDYLFITLYGTSGTLSKDVKKNLTPSMPCKVTLQICDMIKCVRSKQCYTFNTRVKKTWEFWKYGQRLDESNLFQQKVMECLCVSQFDYWTSNN
jgi:hypothetical protein